ncbi:MAG: hypothetical protein V2B14_05850 [bacterium]
MAFFKKISIFIAVLALISLNIISANALTLADSANEQYLDNHGHSKELTRLVNVQKNRIEGKEIPVANKKNKLSKFFRNLFVEPDLTTPVDEFGDRKIQVPETR